MKNRDPLKLRLIFWTVGLVVLLTAFACAPAVATSPPQQEIPVLPPVEVVAPTQTPIILLQDPGQPTATEAEAVPEVQPIATSRGPELHATDPSQIVLASGQLQLIEAFNFW